MNSQERASPRVNSMMVRVAGIRPGEKARRNNKSQSDPNHFAGLAELIPRTTLRALPANGFTKNVHEMRFLARTIPFLTKERI